MCARGASVCVRSSGGGRGAPGAGLRAFHVPPIGTGGVGRRRRPREIVVAVAGLARPRSVRLGWATTLLLPPTVAVTSADESLASAAVVPSSSRCTVEISQTRRVSLPRFVRARKPWSVARVVRAHLPCLWISDIAAILRPWLINVRKNHGQSFECDRMRCCSGFSYYV